jgi:hypothetical protein
MRPRTIATLAYALLAGCNPSGCTSPPPPNVLTQHNDSNRTGWQSHETVLTPRNVRPGLFGKMMTRIVDAQVYAQPLFVAGVDVPGRGKHNVLYVATEANTVYAFDADYPHLKEPLWHVSLGASVRSNEVNCGDLQPQIGITSTPVIDRATNTIYVESKTKRVDGVPWTNVCETDPDGTAYAHRLHALDLATGKEKLGGPVTICGEIPIPDGDPVAFDAKQQHQRPALLLANGVVYLGFGSHCDNEPYYGWVFAYDARTLKQLALYNTAPTKGGASVWQAGMGIAGDEQGNAFVMTGNGSTDDAPGPWFNQRESFIKFWSASGLSGGGDLLRVAGVFPDPNRGVLDGNGFDKDLGSSGAVVIPGLHGGHRLVIGGGKEGRLWAVDRDVMDVVGSIQASDGRYTHHIHGSPAYWDGADGPRMFLMPEQDPLHMFAVTDDASAPIRLAQDSTVRAPGNDSMPGGFISISSNGPVDGVVWVAVPDELNANHGVVRGVLRAFDARNIEAELWDSASSARNELGGHAKFVVPTVADGQVFIPSFANAIDEPTSINAIQVYGLTCSTCLEGTECVHGECQPISHGCGGSCGVTDANGILCECASGQTCDITTNTCCDWTAECAAAGTCATACNGAVTCPCSGIGVCDENGECCKPDCANKNCGTRDGCGGYCIAQTCGAEEACVLGDDGIPYCEDRDSICTRRPSICAGGANPLVTCANPANRCAHDNDRDQHPGKIHSRRTSR